TITISLNVKIVGLVSILISIIITIYVDGELGDHFLALLSITGGSSSGYRLYLFQMIWQDFSRYWLLGLPDSEIQTQLADRFTQGRVYNRFALDNTFVYTALRYGIAPLVILALVAYRLFKTNSPPAVFFVGWFFL